MITDKSQLTGTCYMEVLPGPYAGECWGSHSVFFREETFSQIEAVIRAHVSEYDHWAFTEIPAATWRVIFADLRQTESCSQTTTEFIAWAEKMLASHSVLSVLGI